MSINLICIHFSFFFLPLLYLSIPNYNSSSFVKKCDMLYDPGYKFTVEDLNLRQKCIGSALISEPSIVNLHPDSYSMSPFLTHLLLLHCILCYCKSGYSIVASHLSDLFGI